jgi:hypothetical protein
MPMIWAFSTFTAGMPNDTGLAYHGENKNSWTLTINTDGSASSGGNNGLKVPDAPAATPILTSANYTLY